MFCFVAKGPQTTISVRFVARWPSDHRSRGLRKQPKVAPLLVYGPGAETLHLPVFRPEPSKTAFSLLPVLFLSSAGLPREAGAHTNRRSHRSKSYAHANLRTWAFEDGVFCPSRFVSVCRGSPGEMGAYTKARMSFRFVARGAFASVL
jgi:hypothetical protein